MVDIIVSLITGISVIATGIGAGVAGSVWVLQAGSGVPMKATIAILKAKGF